METKLMVKRLSILVIITVLLLLTLVGQFLTPASAQPISDALLGDLRVVNGLVGLGPVDVYLNESLLAYSLQPETSTPYFSIPAGRYSVTVRLAGADPFSVPIADMLIDLTAGQSMSAI